MADRSSTRINNAPTANTGSVSEAPDDSAYWRRQAQLREAELTSRKVEHKNTETQTERSEQTRQLLQPRTPEQNRGTPAGRTAPAPRFGSQPQPAQQPRRPLLAVHDGFDATPNGKPVIDDALRAHFNLHIDRATPTLARQPGGTPRPVMKENNPAPQRTVNVFGTVRPAPRPVPAATQQQIPDGLTHRHYHAEAFINGLVGSSTLRPPPQARPQTPMDRGQQRLRDNKSGTNKEGSTTNGSSGRTGSRQSSSANGGVGTGRRGK
jgi:hypothetical protein